MGSLNYDSNLTPYPGSNNGIGVTFNACPGMSFNQGEDRTYLVTINDLKAGSPVNLTGATVGLNLPLQGGGSIKRSSGPVNVLPAQVELTGGIQPGIVVLPDHGFVTGDPVQVSSGGTLPAPLAPATDYLIIVFDVNTFGFTDTSGNLINLTTQGVGTFQILNSTDIVLSGTPILGQFTFTLRNLVSAQVNAQLAQTFQVEWTVGGLTRIAIIQNLLDVLAQPVP